MNASEQKKFGALVCGLFPLAVTQEQSRLLQDQAEKLPFDIAAKEIRRIIDRIDKQVAAQGPEAAQIVAEGLPDPRAQGEADVANTEKDNTAKRARKGKSS